jgi:hypothetical protein
MAIFDGPFTIVGSLCFGFHRSVLVFSESRADVSIEIAPI